MRNIKTKRIIALMVLLAVAGLGVASVPVSRASDVPDLPSPICDKLQVPAGNELAFHVYAIGVQVYKWNGIKWTFSGPVAMLFSDASHNAQVGIHYVGPIWESSSGSKVQGSKVAECSPDTTAIPWLLLKATYNTGPGVFSSVTYIQRVNTTGGLTPTDSGSAMDEIREVPYTAEYYFYSAEE